MSVALFGAAGRVSLPRSTLSSAHSCSLVGKTPPLSSTRRTCAHQQVALRRQLATRSTGLGIGLDNALAAAGVVTYVGEILVGGSPLWLVASWMGFGATLRHSQAVLVRTFQNALLTGCVGGPLAYLGGQRLGCLAVSGSWGWLAVSVLWTIALATLYWAAATRPQQPPVV